MTNYDLALARAEMRATGVARFRQIESEASAMLDRVLTATERREHTAVLLMARTFARCFLVEPDDVLDRMFRHFSDEQDTGRRVEA